jgi:hypothetical protein
VPLSLTIVLGLPRLTRWLDLPGLRSITVSFFALEDVYIAVPVDRSGDRDPLLNAINLRTADVYALEECDLKGVDRYRAYRPVALPLR